MIIREKCVCGAEFEINDLKESMNISDKDKNKDIYIAQIELRKFRKLHNHC